MRKPFFLDSMIVWVVGIGCLASVDKSFAQLSEKDFGPPVPVKLKTDSINTAPADKMFIQQLGQPAMEQTPGVYDLFAHLDVGKKTYAVVHLEFEDTLTCTEAVTGLKHVFATYENFVDLFVEADVSQLENISNLPGLVWMEVNRSGLVPPPVRPDFNTDAAKALPLNIVRGGTEQLTGKDTVIAIVDTGIDFTHPDFITYDENGEPVSRLAYYWDTQSESYASGIGQPAGIKFPNGSPIGTIYSREDLTKEIRSSRPRIPVRDLTGHGTSCAGIAAGNGNVVERYAGVAPESDLIAVKVGPGPDLPNTYLIGAICSWLDKSVGDKPLVISCSWGGQLGGRDGQSILERQLSARFKPDRVGRAICFAAGNEGAISLHSEVKVGPKDKPGVMLFKSIGVTQLMMYVNVDSDEGIFVGKIGDNTKVGNPKTHLNPFTQQLVIEVLAEMSGDLGGVYIYTESGQELAADVYISPNGQFLPRFATRTKQLSCPGGATNVLTIGSFDWNDQFDRSGSTVTLTDPVTRQPINVGSASTYSNPGPLRFGSAIKPEISAPGQWYTSPTPINIPALRDSTGFYHPFNGTSAATPYVAGIIALMMERNPQITFGQIREALIENVTEETSDQSQHGHGKLDMDAIKRIFASD